ncbi:MAG: YfhO family protein [Kiritimatiellae bacterium]|nr:YfhO family protein [Kiritimatiellia bacterium]
MQQDTDNTTDARVPAGGLTTSRFALILFVMIAAAYPDALFGLRSFVFRDYGIGHYPVAHYHRQSLLHGEIPHWNPLSNCGLPFLAQWGTLVLYPGSVLYLLFDPSWSLGLFCLAHLLLAGVAMYRLALDWTQNRPAASVAGVGFALNGLALNCLQWPHMMAALAWMPLVVLLTGQACRAGGRAVIKAGLAGTLQMLTGAPEFILFTWLIAAAVACADRRTGGVTLPRRLGRLAAVVALVTGLSAAQLLPFLDLLRHSHRHTGFATGRWSIPITGWANFFVPLFQTGANPQGVRFMAGQFWISSYYLGLPVFVLGWLAVFRLRSWRVMVLACTAVAGLTLAFGEESFVYPALRALMPIVGFMRYPVKFVTLVIFAVPLLAACAVRAWQGGPGADTASVGRRALALAWTASLALAAAIVLSRGTGPGADKDRWAVLLSGATRAAFLTVALLVLHLLRRPKRPGAGTLAEVALVFLIGLDALTHTPRQNPTVARGVATKPNLPDLQALAPLPRHGESRAMPTPEANRKFLFTTLADPEADYIGKRLGLFGNCNLLDGISKINGIWPLYLSESGAVWSLPYARPERQPQGVLDFLGVSQISVPGNACEWQPRAGWMPFVSAGQRPVFAGAAETLARLGASEFDPRAIVYLPREAEPHIRARERADVAVLNPIVTAHRVEAQVRTDRPTLVLVAQAYYHPWRAAVDGKRVRLWRANYGFQAVAIPAGEHAVVLAYRDKAFRVGALISVLTLALCVAGWIRTRRPA